MENASKALVIAGGILLAMLTISLLFLLLSNINSSKMTEEEKLAAKQLQEFNQQWEAYNKKVLYGTDVISVLNKAMDNNSKASVEDDTNKYYVNVKVNLIDCGEPYLEPGDNNWVNPAKFGPPYEGKEQWPTEY